MNNPHSIPSTPAPDWIDQEALRHAAGGRDLIDWLRDLERRLERLESQLNTT